LTTLGGCASSPTQRSTGQYLDDSATTVKVKAAIFNDPTLRSSEINVETFQGTVQFPCLYAKNQILLTRST